MHYYTDHLAGRTLTEEQWATIFADSELDPRIRKTAREEYESTGVRIVLPIDRELKRGLEDLAKQRQTTPEVALRDAIKLVVWFMRNKEAK